MSSVGVEVPSSRKSGPCGIKSDKKKSKKTNVNPPSPQVRPVSIIQKIFRNRNQANSQYYSSKAYNISETTQRDVTTEQTPFKYPRDIETFSYKVVFRAWKKKQRIFEKALPLPARPSRRSRQSEDILKRTFVADPEDHVKTVVDIDPDYFTIIEGRPIRAQHKQAVYIQDLRSCLITKLMAAFRDDEVLRAEELFMEEQHIIDTIKQKYKKYVDIFEDFISKDHDSSMKLLHQAETQCRLTQTKEEIFKENSREFGNVKVKIYILEEQWRNAKMYQKFLYQTSPMSWRREFDYIHKRVRPTHTSLVTDWSALFGRYRLASTGSIASLDSLIDMFLEDVRTQEEPKLYFTEPYQLVKVFRTMEMQNLNSLLHSEDLAIPLENMLVSMEVTKDTIGKEFAAMQELIDDIEANIQWYEDRSESLEEEAMQLIHGTFKRLVCHDETLHLFVNVEDLYEAVIAPNDANLGIYDMMRGIEVHYETFLLELDTISFEAVRSAESEAYSEEAKMMKNAKDAARKVALIDILTHKLKRVLEPPQYQTTRALKPRSPPPERKITTISGTRNISQADQDYLDFFTDFCSTDDAHIYGINSK